MARKRKYDYITDPTLKACVVVNRFVSEAKVNLDNWTKDYKNEINKYLSDSARQELAALRLAGFYVGISQPEVRNAIREAVNKAKARQAEVVAAGIEKVPTPAVSDAAKKLAEKIAGIITAAAPAV